MVVLDYLPIKWYSKWNFRGESELEFKFFLRQVGFVKTELL